MPFYSPIYSIPYVIITIFLGLLSLNSRLNKNKAIRVFVYILLLIFIGLRGHLGTDFVNYYPTFEELPTLSGIGEYLFSSDKYEIGFYLWTSILKTIFPNYHLWVFINTLIDLSILYWFLNKYSRLFFLSLTLFFAINGLQIEIDLFRNAKAIFLFLLAIPSILQRDFVKYNLIMALCISFHFSAIILYPLYFLGIYKFSKYKLLIIFALVNIIYLCQLFPTTYILSRFIGIGDAAVLEKLNEYMQSEGEGYGLSIGYLEKTSIFIWSYINYIQLDKSNRSRILFFNCYFLYYVFWYVFADVTVFVQRIPLLFVFSYWVVVPNMIYRSKYKKLLKVFFIIFCILKAQIQFSRNIYYYDNVITGIASYDKRANELYSNQIYYK